MKGASEPRNRRFPVVGSPSFVPIPVLRPTDAAYRGPRRLLGPWTADRPGEVVGEGQPNGGRLGVQGPDQGYALLLARTLVSRLHLAAGEHLDDVVVGCVGVALKRSALFGRAPVLADLEVAFGLFGFFGDSPSIALVEKRRRSSPVWRTTTTTRRRVPSPTSCPRTCSGWHRTTQHRRACRPDRPGAPD